MKQNDESEDDDDEEETSEEDNSDHNESTEGTLRFFKSVSLHNVYN